MAINKVDFEQLMNQAKVTLVGASEGGLKGAFYDVLSEFFNDSSIWTTDIPVHAIPGVFSYPISVPEGQIIRLTGVADLQQNYIPSLMPEIGTLLIQHSPNQAIDYVATVVTNTALPTSRDMIPLAPDWILPIWHVGILDGLLGKMMIQPNKSYSNMVQGAYHLRRFRDAIARARVSKLRANTNGASAWRFPQQFRTRTQQGGVPSVGSGGVGERSF